MKTHGAASNSFTEHLFNPNMDMCILQNYPWLVDRRINCDTQSVRDHKYVMMAI